MSTEQLVRKLTPRTRRSFVFGVAVAACVLAGTIAVGWVFVRNLVRQQIAQRDADALHATTLMEQLDARNGNDTGLDDEQVGFEAAILASRLRGVMGIRFFETSGRFKDAFPPTIQPKHLGAGELKTVQALKPHSRFLAEMPLSDVFIYLPQFATGNVARVPALEVTVPLHHRDREDFAGAAQFILEGESIRQEYARLDRHLAGLAVSAFMVGVVLLVTMLWPVFRQVENLNRDLAARGERLQRANQELELAARGAALGAVSAHLMHGLKNPLASLSQFISTRGQESVLVPDETQDALAAARRMQSLVESTLEVLADARGEATYEVTATELSESVNERMHALAAARGVTFQTKTGEPAVVPSQVANLARLVLVNLCENAIQATPAGKTVSLETALRGDALEFLVRDQGSGFPEHLRPGLFLPCRSTREGGSGIGLAISKQITDYLGAQLVLRETSSAGCSFAFSVPLGVTRPAAVITTRDKGGLLLW